MESSVLFMRMVISAGWILVGATHIIRGRRQEKENKILGYEHFLMAAMSFSIGFFNVINTLLKVNILIDTKNLFSNLITCFYIGLGCMSLYFCYIAGKSKQIKIFIEIVVLTLMNFFLAFLSNSYFV